MNSSLSLKSTDSDMNCTCANPAKCLGKMFVDKVHKIRAGQCPVRRPVFLRTHGAFKGRIIFDDTIPATFKHGLFDPEYRAEKQPSKTSAKKGSRKKKPKSSYPVYIRFSSDLSDSRPDLKSCLLYTSPSPRDATLSRMPSSA